MQTYTDYTKFYNKNKNTKNPLESISYYKWYGENKHKDKKPTPYHLFYDSEK